MSGDWSSDVCSSDLTDNTPVPTLVPRPIRLNSSAPPFRALTPWFGRIGPPLRTSSSLGSSFKIVCGRRTVLSAGACSMPNLARYVTGRMSRRGISSSLAVTPFGFGEWLKSGLGFPTFRRRSGTPSTMPFLGGITFFMLTLEGRRILHLFSCLSHGKFGMNGTGASSRI